MRAVPKFLLFRIPGSGYLGEVSIGSAKRSTFGKAASRYGTAIRYYRPRRSEIPSHHPPQLPCTTLSLLVPLSPSTHLPLFPPFPLFFLFPQRDYYLSPFNLLHHALSLDFLSFLPFAAIFSLPLFPLTHSLAPPSTRFFFFFSVSFPYAALLPPHSVSNDSVQHSRQLRFVLAFPAFLNLFLFLKPPLHLFLTCDRSICPSLFFSLSPQPRSHAVITEEDRRRINGSNHEIIARCWPRRKTDWISIPENCQIGSVS